MFRALREYVAVFLDPHGDIDLVTVPRRDADRSLVSVDSYVAAAVQRKRTMDILRVGGAQDSGGSGDENQAA